METEVIINKVAQSSMVSLDLATYYPTGERKSYDLAQNLYGGLILREKDFREFLKQHDWEAYREAFVAVFCSADAIVPVWAYMLLASHLQTVAKEMVFGTAEELEKKLFEKKLQNIDLEEFKDKKVVIKGCSEYDIPPAVYAQLTEILRPVAASIMYGEPCSTVPIFKRK